MSAGVATEIIQHATTEVEFGMVECRSGADRRTPALAVLPSVTEMSRSSLLAGRLTSGQQDAERRNFAAFTSARAWARPRSSTRRASTPAGSQ